MIQLTRFLGFYPKAKPEDKLLFFDLQEGKFVNKRPAHKDYFGERETEIWRNLSVITFENSDTLNITTKERRLMIDFLINYYQLHLPGFHTMKSVEVLKSILD